MKIQWRELLISITFWSIAEIGFSLLGIDDLADYGEFILEKQILSIRR
jgi:hypothetical protein